ncbi:hypothetical protein MUK42_35302 [Musa troglodytarum]|uniref:Ribosomal protein L31 n=1 Tax=Musa troglodytarum TaxID=320322 RepID=A0A9E7HZD1_9LILI|nr:hypothetical protein MUK42_35302 [Musa troglodytarum]
MKKGLHPQLEWISYVTQSGRLMHVIDEQITSCGSSLPYESHASNGTKLNFRFPSGLRLRCVAELSSLNRL